MQGDNTKTLTRDCEAVRIPSGVPVRLTAGTEVVITQALGGSYTVATHHGLLRIDERDADALGFSAEPEAGAAPAPSTGVQDDTPIEEQLWNALRLVYDPEIPVNIVDLGLVYDCRAQDRDEGGRCAIVKMTLTAPGCAMGPMIAEDARRRLLQVPGIEAADVELVWDPPWNQDMISEAGRMQLGMI